MKQKLEVSYVEFTQGFYFYKQDTVGKVAQTEEEFNKGFGKFIFWYHQSSIKIPMPMVFNGCISRKNVQ